MDGDEIYLGILCRCKGTVEAMKMHNCFIC
jgi:hypothetical protein